MKQTIFEKIDSAAADRANYLADLESKKAKAEAEQKAKELEAMRSLDHGTADEYAKAKGASKYAADHAEYYTKKLNEMKAADLFDKASRDEYKKEIKAVTDKKAAEELAKCKAAIAEALKAANEYRDTMLKADAYFEKIQAHESHANEIMVSVGMIRSLTAEGSRAIFDGIK